MKKFKYLNNFSRVKIKDKTYILVSVRARDCNVKYQENVHLAFESVCAAYQFVNPVYVKGYNEEDFNDTILLNIYTDEYELEKELTKEQRQVMILKFKMLGIPVYSFGICVIPKLLKDNLIVFRDKYSEISDIFGYVNFNSFRLGLGMEDSAFYLYCILKDAYIVKKKKLDIANSSFEAKLSHTIDVFGHVSNAMVYKKSDFIVSKPIAERNGTVEEVTTKILDVTKDFVSKIMKSNNKELQYSHLLMNLVIKDDIDTFRYDMNNVLNPLLSTYFMETHKDFILYLNKYISVFHNDLINKIAVVIRNTCNTKCESGAAIIESLYDDEFKKPVFTLPGLRVKLKKGIVRNKYEIVEYTNNLFIPFSNSLRTKKDILRLYDKLSFTQQTFIEVFYKAYCEYLEKELF